jgi:hypothetical protein
MVYLESHGDSLHWISRNPLNHPANRGSAAQFRGSARDSATHAATGNIEQARSI